MDKKLQDLAWSVLPKEFKEEVKYKYNKTKTKKIKKECDLGFLNAHEGMFGVHNLTSDAEGEEMLTVPRKKVKEKWQRACEQEAKYGRAQDSPVAREELYYNRGILSILDTLFGSKCLPDELNEDNFAKSEPKPAEPKEDKHFDNILKEGFRGHNRLHIAAQIVAALYANHQAAKGFKSIEELVRKALDITDTLIKESEKGGEV